MLRIDLWRARQATVGGAFGRRHQAFTASFRDFRAGVRDSRCRGHPYHSSAFVKTMAVIGL